jgi:phthiodiolone/phenolphthiodiolone dimycocerosates ketoreductase
LKREVEKAGRDPDAFRIGVWFQCLVHEDGDLIAKALEHPLLRFHAAIFGRLQHDDWRAEGVPAVFDPGWHYALHYLPTRVTRDEADAIAAKVTPEMMDRSYLRGGPVEMASVFQDYIDAGADWVAPFDLLPAAAPSEGLTSTERLIELCRHVKDANPARPSPDDRREGP